MSGEDLQSRILKDEWKDFYNDAEEQLPIRGPEPLGNPVRLSAYVEIITRAILRRGGPTRGYSYT